MLLFLQTKVRPVRALFRLGPLLQRRCGPTAVPKVNCGRITVIGDKHVVGNPNEWKGIVVSCGTDDGGANSEQTNVEGPQVLEGGADMPEGARADHRIVGEGGAIERDHQTANGSN